MALTKAIKEYFKMRGECTVAFQMSFIYKCFIVHYTVHSETLRLPNKLSACWKIKLNVFFINNFFLKYCFK